MEKIIVPENWNCPECNADFSEDDMVETCNEPFNGNVIKCKECENEFYVEILFSIKTIN